FKGISTNLKTGDTLLLALGNGKDQQVLRTVESVDIQADYKRTEVILTEASLGMTGSISHTVSEALQPFVDDASDTVWEIEPVIPREASVSITSVRLKSACMSTDSTVR